MLLEFNIEYHTQWGEETKLCGNAPELGAYDERKAIALKTSDGIHWLATVEMIHQEGINYYYFVSANDQTIRKEWSLPPRCISIHESNARKYKLYDSWRDIPMQSSYFSSAFTQVFLKRQPPICIPKDNGASLRLNVYCPGLDESHTLAISGNQEILGNWDDRKVLLLCENASGFTLELDTTVLNYPVEYKFVLYNLKENNVEKWEEGNNRLLNDPGSSEDESVILSDFFVNFDLPLWKGAGVTIPVFSLRSDESFGVGDFSDLKKMIDWASLTGQSIVQILPVNDTTLTHSWRDSYPYDSISIFAIHPMYLHLDGLGSLSDEAKRIDFDRERKRLNAFAAVDYEDVNRVKWEYIHSMFEQEGDQVLSFQEFK